MRIKTRRYLRPKKFTNVSKKFFVFDTETGICKNGKIEYMLSARPEHLIFGVVYGEDFQKILYSAEEFKKEFLKKRYRGKIVYAHNAEYDLSAVYGNIYEMDQGAIFNGKFITATNGNCKFADSYNVIPAGVKKLGELLGLKKMELGNNLKSTVKDLARDVEYCIRDCEIVYKSLKKIFVDVDPSYTIGSISLKLFKSKYLNRTIKINEYSDDFFEATYGGRTEAFKLGECEGFVYDINSAYPKVMRDRVYPDPSKLRKILRREIVTKADDWNRYVSEMMHNYEGMITCSVHVPTTEKMPVLPYRTNDRLIFPCGNFSGSWTFPEMRQAIIHGTIITDLVSIVYAPAIASPFFDFMNDHYNLRLKTKDEFEKYYYKLFMNNLFGKLLQRAREEFRFCKTDKDAKEFMRKFKIRYAEFIEVNGGYFIKYENYRVFAHTVACWGSYVTAYVRQMLHEIMSENVDDILYCDTDSIVISKKLNIDSTTVLGGWKLEDKTVTKIRALKDYVYFDKDGVEKQMLKGVKKDAIQLDKDANVFKYKRMIKTRESMRRIDNLPPGTFIDQVKFLTGDYLKREVLKGGFTKPFIL